MKKISLILGLLIVILSTGCIKRDSFENIEIYTTVYPIEYITNRLYGDNSEVKSIYPNGVITKNYQLTDKQIKDFSNADLFVFDGQSDEKNYVIPMFGFNNSLRIIDTSITMEATYGNEELWLDPSNFLMLAQNVRNGLKEYVSNSYLRNEIDSRYEELKIEISNIDASLRLLAESSTTRYLLVDDNTFKFLEKYGFEIISLDEDTVSDRTIVDAEKLIKEEKISYIYTLNNTEISEFIQNFVEKNEIEIITLHSISNLTDEEQRARVNFIDIKNDNIELLKKELY